jgi:muconolactone delta-isomerase
MEYLVTMTTRVPEETPDATVQDVWGVLTILDRASRLRGSVHARATPEVQPAVQG